MKTYRGKRTDAGCAVTVDGVPLPMRSDLSGNATTPYDWGYVGSGQLSLALLSNFLADDSKAKDLCELFEQKIVAQLDMRSWTMTDRELGVALAALKNSSEAAHEESGEVCNEVGIAFGDMPVQSPGPVTTEQPEQPAPKLVPLGELE